MKPTFAYRGRLPGLNEYTASCRGNALAANRMKQAAEKDIGWAIVQANVPRFRIPVRVCCCWHEPPSGNGQRRDLDNIVFAKKFLFDAMVRQHVLVDDDLEHVREVKECVVLEPRGADYGVEVWVEELEDTR